MRVQRNGRLHGLENLVSGSACNQCSDLALPKLPSRTILESRSRSRGISSRHPRRLERWIVALHFSPHQTTRWPRPFRVDPHLPSLLAALDEHWFPSGHAMSLSGVLVPVVFVWPAAAMSAAALMLIMAWSRIATAHHYPSDILAGTLLGIVLAYPLSVCFFAVW